MKRKNLLFLLNEVSKETIQLCIDLVQRQRDRNYKDYCIAKELGDNETVHLFRLIMGEDDDIIDQLETMLEEYK